jgi:hypothetical protein
MAYQSSPTGSFSNGIGRDWCATYPHLFVVKISGAYEIMMTTASIIVSLIPIMLGEGVVAIDPVNKFLNARRLNTQ